MPDDRPVNRPAKAPWRTIYFRLEAPEARMVSLVGDFNDWNAERHLLRRAPSGLWECQVPLPAGDYAYAFVVDGIERPDPHCQRRVDSRAGAVRCLITVSAPETS